MSTRRLMSRSSSAPGGRFSDEHQPPEPAIARRNPYTTVAIISKALSWLIDQGLAQKVSEEDGGTYRALPRFRILVRELSGGELYADVLRLAENDTDIAAQGRAG